MDWMDIACIVLASTAVNHLGLIAAVERIIRHSLPVIRCPKCLTFWSVLAYGIAAQRCASPHVVPRLLAISLLCSYLAIWLELIMYSIDTLYNRIYGILKDNNQEEDPGEDHGEGG